MKWWHWLILEVLIIFGVIAWIYFFPSEIEDDFAKGLVGFVLIYAIEEYKDINRRKTMDYKEGMTCGKCLKYAFCPVANHNANHKACMKITIAENYTIEQNAGENRIEGGVVGISGSVDYLKKITDLEAENEEAKEIIRKLLHALKNENSDYTFALENTHPLLAEAKDFIKE